MTKTLLRLWAAYMEEPIMVKETDIFSHRDVRNLPVSDDLKEAIQAWDEEYQSTFDSGYPPDSGFVSPDLKAAHQKQGAKLAERLQEELGDGYSVEYKL